LIPMDKGAELSDILEGLNDTQREAVKHMESPLLVFAGPGTGKTRVVTHKIAYLIKEKGYKPEEILALTFSDSAAQEMQERVEELLPGVTGIKISTFHSYCYEIIRQYSLEIGINSQANVIQGEHQQTFLLQHLDDIGLTAFKVPSQPIDLAKSFNGTITRFKQENIPLEKLEEYLEKQDENEEYDQEELEKLRDLAKAYRLYEAWKAEKSLIDYGDMQYLALELLKRREKILDRIRGGIKYIIVDEFQDTDYMQLQLVLALAPTGNVTVVGDDDQSIYRFRGAYLTNIAEFKEHYEKHQMRTESIVLETNYRCTGNIQKIATRLIKHNPERQEKEIKTNKDRGPPVSITVYSTDWDQAMGIVEKIKELNRGGVPWNDMAILMRRRTDAKPIIEQMEKNRVPYEIIGSREYFKEPVVRAVLSYLKVLQDPCENQPSIGHLMQRPVHGILPGEIQKICRYAKDKNTSIWEALADLGSYEGDNAHMERFREELENLFQIKGEGDLMTTVRAVLFSKDFFRNEILRENRDNIRLLNRFLRMTSEYTTIYPEGTLDDFMTYLYALSSLGLEEKENGSTTGRVNLMTIHGSKGKEFPYVFIPCLNEGRLPSRYKPYKIEIPEELQDGIASKYSKEEIHEQEERRLLYVATTRAMEMAYMSSCKRYGENKRDTPQSRYLTDILVGDGFEMTEDEGREPIITEEGTGTLTSLLNHRIISGIAREEWQEAIDAMTALAKHRDCDTSELAVPADMDAGKYLKELEELYSEPEKAHVENASYSPSKLKCYEDCPRKYYYQYVLGIPDVQKTFFELGTLVHAVIEQITRKIREGETTTTEEALKLLDSMWKPSVYKTKEKERQDREEAEKMMRDFMAHQQQKTTSIAEIERYIELDLDGRKIKGKVDRIDDNGKTLEVIDYKTSKTKTSKPQLKKDFQMALYWLGAEKALGKPVTQVGHWYLREDREWMIDMTPKELQEVLERAKEIIESVEAGSFPATPEYQTCQWCGYRDLCDER